MDVIDYPEAGELSWLPKGAPQATWGDRMQEQLLEMRINMLKFAGALALTACLLPLPASAQGLVTVRDVSYDVALVMATTAIERCRSQGFKIGVSVVDRGGHVLVTLRDHGAAHHTVELAQRKALHVSGLPTDDTRVLTAAPG